MKEGEEIPPQVLGYALEWYARRHLEGVEAFPAGYLDALCEYFLLFADHIRSITKPDKRGVQAAMAAEALSFVKDMPKGRAQKAMAEAMGVELNAVKQAQKRIRKKRMQGAPPAGKKRGTK